jgi:hypothetical protein
MFKLRSTKTRAETYPKLKFTEKKAPGHKYSRNETNTTKRPHEQNMGKQKSQKEWHRRNTPQCTTWTSSPSSQRTVSLPNSSPPDHPSTCFHSPGKQSLVLGSRAHPSWNQAYNAREYRRHASRAAPLQHSNSARNQKMEKTVKTPQQEQSFSRSPAPEDVPAFTPHDINSFWH